MSFFLRRIGRAVCGFRSRAASCSRFFFERVLPNAIIVPRHLWIFTLGGVFVCSLIAIFYKPGIRLPDQEDFQVRKELGFSLFIEKFLFRSEKVFDNNFQKFFVS